MEQVVGTCWEYITEKSIMQNYVSGLLNCRLIFSLSFAFPANISEGFHEQHPTFGWSVHPVLLVLLSLTIVFPFIGWLITTVIGWLILTHPTFVPPGGATPGS